MGEQRTRREMLQWAAAAGAASVIGAGDAFGQAGGSRRPNILIFMTDQQRGDSVAPYRRAHTPNVDRLAREGVTFAQAYCPSPHCCPSRATFFTGLYPSEHGVWNNVDVGNALSRGPFQGTRLFSDDLKEAGYELYFSGKWHVSALDTPADRGWTMSAAQMGGRSEALVPGMTAPRKPGDWHGYDGRPPLNEWHRYALLAQRPEQTQRHEAQILRPGYGTYTHYGQAQPGGRGGFAFDRRVVDDAIRFIRQRKPGGNPWVQYVGIIGPHDPYFLPKEFLDRYKIDDIKLPDNFADRMADKPALYRRTRDRFDQLPDAEHREALRHYLAYCSYVDALIGEVIKALEETGELDDTLVLYTSDHGDYASEHGLWCKGLPCFRGAYHIPAVARWPGGIKEPGRTVDAFVSTADFAPTFLDIAGVKVDRPLTGRSLVPFLRGDPAPPDWRDAVFTQSNGNELYGIQRSVSTRKWKYVYNGFDYDELYDLEADPGETKNLASGPKYRDVVREMCRRLWRFAFEHKDVAINDYILVALAPFGPAEAFRKQT
ncbi:MAG TPA: sulfatase-like hydrolase/transferase [Tepidisphaeraceae bacterium]